MGLQSMPVDIPPPQRLNGDSAPQSQAKNLSSSFDGYLNDARSAVATEPVDQDREAPRTEAKPPADVDKSDTEATPSKDKTEETKVQEPAVVAAPTVATGALVPNLSPDAVEPPAESASSGQRQPLVLTEGRPHETPIAQPTQSLPVDSPQRGETQQQEAKVPGQNPELSANPGARPVTTSEKTAPGEPVATKTLTDQPHEAPKPVDAPSSRLQKAADQTTVADQGRAREEAVAGQPSGNPKRIDQIAPDQSQAPGQSRNRARKEAIGEQQQSQPKRATLFNDDQGRTRQDSVRATNTAPTPVTIKAGRGDGAAASFARFLITAADQTGPGSSGNTPASASTGGFAQATGNVAPAAVAGPAPVADLVADLLAARVDDADAIKGAARVLNASRGSGRHQVTMQLDPPELGQLKLQIQMNAHGLSLRVDAQTHAVARIIESRLTELSDALAIHGIRVDRAQVTVRPAASTNPDTQPSQDNGRSGQGNFNQASDQNHGDRNHGEPAPQWTADQHPPDPKHSSEDFGGAPAQDDLISPAGLGAKTNDSITPAAESSVNLVA